MYYYYILNVGMADGEQPDFIYKEEYVELAVNHAFRGLPEPRIRFTKQGKEPTAVVTVCITGVQHSSLNHRIQTLSELLNQDCIAVWDMAKGVGSLIGHVHTRKQKWGEFDEQYFQI